MGPHLREHWSDGRPFGKCAKRFIWWPEIASGAGDYFKVVKNVFCDDALGRTLRNKIKISTPPKREIELASGVVADTVITDDRAYMGSVVAGVYPKTSPSA